MYITAKEVHIAIDTQLQQVSTSRKQAFRPEEYDMVINNILLQYIDDKISPKTNAKREGFEYTQERIDELRELKRKVSLRFYNDSSKNKFINLPANYFRIITGGCEVTSHYNKRNLTITNTPETIYKYVLGFPDNTPSSQGSEVYSNLRIHVYGSTMVSYTKKSYSLTDKFEIIRYILDYLNKSNAYGVYWERYDNSYHASSFIIISKTAIGANPILSFNESTQSPVNVTGSLISINNNYTDSTGNLITSPIDVISSKDKIDILNNNYMSKNRYKKPICTLDNNRLNIYFDNTFVPLRIDFEYLIKPTRINYYYNVMPEITINDEIIKRTVDTLKAFIKDEQGYQMFLNQVNKTQ